MRFWIKQVISEKLKKRVKNHEDLIVDLMRKNDELMLENIQLMHHNKTLIEILYNDDEDVK